MGKGSNVSKKKAAQERNAKQEKAANKMSPNEAAKLMKFTVCIIYTVIYNILHYIIVYCSTHVIIVQYSVVA